MQEGASRASAAGWPWSPCSPWKAASPPASRTSEDLSLTLWLQKLIWMVPSLAGILEGVGNLCALTRTVDAGAIVVTGKHRLPPGTRERPSRLEG